MIESADTQEPGSGFDDDPFAGEKGRTGRDATDPKLIGEDSSRFVEDFETGIESDTFADKWIAGGTLPDVPVRLGFVQRYINTLDANNLSNQMRRGWVPRRKETLPEGFTMMPTIQHGDYAGFIGVNGQVLMEMPVKLFKMHEKHQQDQTRRLEQAVENDLYKVGTSGKMTPTEKQATTRTSVGRVPNIPE